MARGSAGRIDLQAVATEAVVLLPRAVYTTAFNSPILVNGGGTQLVIYLVSWTIGSASLTLSVADIAPGDFTATLLLASAAITTNTTTRLRVSPHLTAAANTIGKEIVPALFQIQVAVGSAQPAEYSLAYSLS
jgi:hypothetical protein